MSAVRVLHWDEDLVTQRVTWGNGASAFVGEEVDVPDGREWWEGRVHPEDLDQLRTEALALRSGQRAILNAEYRVRVARGWRLVREQIVVVEELGKPVRLVGTIRDATPAPVLAESERRFATFIDQLPLLAWEADADGWIDFYNQRWFTYTGTTLEEMEGWGWTQVHVASDLPRQLRVWRNALENGLPWEDMFRLRGADGAFRWHLSRAFPLRNASGEIVRWFGSNTDVHDQRLALEEREHLLKIEQRLRADAEAVVREKDEFVAVVSHELRTPLANVLTRAQLLRPGVSDPRLATGLEKIEQNAERLARLIEDLLDTSRIISGKLEVGHELVDVSTATRAAIESFATDAAKRGVTIQCDAPSEPALVIGTGTRIEQIATNLIGNAVKFSNDASTVRATVRATAHEVMLEVRDEGEGIESAMLPQLFQRFRQGDSSARRRHGGLGLGLSIVRHLVVAHGGRVEAASDGPGKGSTFRAFFPAAQTNTELLLATQPRHSATEPAVSLAGIRVLGVDDDADTRDVLALALIACGATITVVGSVAEALDRLRLEIPDVILSDLAMPEIDGFGLVERVRASADPRIRALPIVAVTAHATSKDRDLALRAGFDSYVAKPFNTSMLSRLIAELVQQRLMTPS